MASVPLGIDLSVAGAAKAVAQLSRVASSTRSIGASAVAFGGVVAGITLKALKSVQRFVVNSIGAAAKMAAQVRAGGANTFGLSEAGLAAAERLQSKFDELKLSIFKAFIDNLPVVEAFFADVITETTYATKFFGLMLKAPFKKSESIGKKIGSWIMETRLKNLGQWQGGVNVVENNKTLAKELAQLSASHKAELSDNAAKFAKRFSQGLGLSKSGIVGDQRREVLANALARGSIEEVSSLNQMRATSKDTRLQQQLLDEARKQTNFQSRLLDAQTSTSEVDLL